MAEEQIIFRGSPSLITKFGAIFLALLVAAGGITAVFMMNNNWFWILPALAFIHILVLVILVRSTVYEVTTQRIRFIRGIVTRRTDELELYRVKDTTLIEPVSLRMFGRGHVEISTFDPSTPVLQLEAIPGPRKVREDLRRYVEECRDRKGVRVTEFSEDTPPSPS